MQLSADATLPFDRELVFRSYRDDLERLVDYLPNVRAIKVKSRDVGDGTVSFINEWHGGGEIPAAARVVLSESMLGWTDYATWNESDFSCEWRIETRSFTEAVRCQGRNRFLEVEGGTRLEIRGELEIDATKIKGVPRLLQGRVKQTVEDFLVKKITPNLLSVSDGLQRYLEKVTR
ncbi:MAG: SRPBCC family protein [Polyangiaceae bacterium]